MGSEEVEGLPSGRTTTLWISQSHTIDLLHELATVQQVLTGRIESFIVSLFCCKF